jgi:hypothetical protein
MLSAATVRSKLLHGRMPHSANLLILYLHSPPPLVLCLDWQEARQNQVTSDQVVCGDHLAHPKSSVLSMFPH